MNNDWLNKASRNLLDKSQEKINFVKAREEWIYIGLEDNEDADFNCELCDHKDIRYEYTIQNKLNGNEMIVGSSCINKFIDHLEANKEKLLDDEGYAVDHSRLETDKKEYWKKILFSKLDELFISSDFQKSITETIKQKGKLTINQAKTMRFFYSKLNKMEQQAFRKCVSIRLVKKAHKEQYELLDRSDKVFIDMLLSSDQRKRLL
ncbi:hypothetical protein [Enterococcus ureilyticus]|uniref:hypothetical protein n=1 Tax=Enterococcus ureilyticus TaxID=1131292 RepID=UPI001F0BA3B3|nr:hypothetical protein [Enterococcus ureilyticus]MBM7690302.1 hypothetical protein [Enterococcus ureilyticus]